MNITVLEKLEKSYVKLDWRNHIQKLTLDNLETVVDTIDNFKTNKGAKELVIFRFRNTPFYVTVKRKEYKELLNYLLNKFLDFEKYEMCRRINDIKNKL